mgnify:CR=1 FL=1
MDILLQFIHNNAINREMKCHIFFALADCMVGAKEKAWGYTAKVIQVIDLGFQAVC